MMLLVPRKKKLWGGLALAVTLFAAVAAYFAWSRGTAGPPPLPSPNGYDDFLAAADSIVADPSLDANKATLEELRELVGANGKALELVRLGLGRECGVPLEYSQQHLEVGGERAQKMRGLGRLLVAQGRLAEQEGRPADAMRSYLDVVRLGQAMCRGGLMIDRTLGNVLEGSYGITPLKGLCRVLDAASREKLIGDLEALDRGREPFEDCAAREHAFQDALIDQMGFLARYRLGPTLKKLASPPETQARQKYLVVQTELRLLVIELAIQCHLAERGSPPEGLGDLVPRYLSAVPRDPADGRPFEYNRDPDGFYSVGPSTKAEEGKAAKSPLP